MADLMMQFKQNAPVRTADDEKVGEISRVVINACSHEISHLVISRGFLFTKERLLPMDLVEEATANSVVLKRRSDKLELPEYNEDDFLSFDDLDLEASRRAYPEGCPRPMISYLPVGERRAYKQSASDTVGRVPIKTGAKVISGNDEHVGDVKRVFADPTDDEVTHILIERGILFSNEKLVPIDWVRSASADDVRLGVSDRALERLPDYEAQD
jgi:uncharacterized protein YrrD